MSSKMTVQQKALLLEWLEKPENRWVMWTSAREYSPEKIKRKWNELGKILNGCRFGTKKGPEKWRKTFVELRCHIKKKYRTRMADKKAGSGSPAALTEVEQRFANIFRLGEDSGSDDSPRHAPCDEPGLRPKVEDEVGWQPREDDRLSDKSSSPDRNLAKKKIRRSEELESPQNETLLTSSECEKEADIVTQSWAIKLNRMEPRQRLLAEKFINDIIFEGEMGNLHRNVIHFNLHGESGLTVTNHST